MADPDVIAAEARKKRGFAHLSEADLILIAVKFVKRECLACEPELSLCCWPAYSDMSPWRRNIEFARCYQTAFRAYFDLHVGRNLVDKVKGIDLSRIIAPSVAEGDAGKGGHLTSLNAIRQEADRYGLPYEPFINFCMEFATNRGVKTAPRPHQLLPRKFTDKWRAALGNRKDEFLATMPSRYREEMRRPRSARRGCLALPGAYDPASPICSDCPLLSRCGELVSAIERKVEMQERRAGLPQTDTGIRDAKKKARSARNTIRMRAARGKKKPVTKEAGARTASVTMTTGRA